MGELTEKVKQLTEQVATLTTSRQARGPCECQKPATRRLLSLRYYKCQGIGHFQCDCPMTRYNNSHQCTFCVQRDHITWNW